MRLKAIAVERAPTIATEIQTICDAVGIPRAASTAPRKANGSANSVCSILIISSVVRMFFVIAATVAYLTRSLLLEVLYLAFPPSRRRMRNAKLIEDAKA